MKQPHAQADTVALTASRYTLIGVAVLIGLVSWLVLSLLTDSAVQMGKKLMSVQDHQQVRIRVGSAELLVEVVNTPGSITQGLSGRESIGADGMLFVFPEPYRAQFWMKDMLFDLDMVWFAAGTAVAVTEHVPKPDSGTLLDDLPNYEAGQPVDMVLELPAGKASELGITIGSGMVFLGLGE